MVTIDRHGHTVNTANIFGIQWRCMYRDGSWSPWCKYGRYKTMESCLQALDAYKKAPWAYWKAVQYRPCHVYYEL
jgi:hypothetical protein